MKLLKLPLVFLCLLLALLSVTVEILFVVLLFVMFSWAMDSSSMSNTSPFENISLKKKYHWFMDKFSSMGKFFKRELS